MTVRDSIIECAKDYPDRPAIITASSAPVLYRDLAKRLPENFGRDVRTSGTTGGKQKRVLLTEEMLSRKIDRIGRRGRAFQHLTKVYLVSVDSSTVWQNHALHLLLKGATIFTRSGSFDPRREINMCEANGVEGLFFVPQFPIFWEFINLEHDYRFSWVIVNSGAATRNQLRVIKDAMAENLWVNYGTTESGPIAGGSFDQVGKIEGCVGPVVDGVEVETVEGQIRVRCDAMATEYVDDPQLSAEKFKGGWFYTGDLGHFEQGMLVIDGRA